MTIVQKLSAYASALRSALAVLGLHPKQLALAGAVALLLVQNAQVLYYVAQNGDSGAVIRAFDDDAGNAIDVTGRSRWVTDNGFASYGPVYFRVASTVGAWLRPIAEPGGLKAFDAGTRADHFALMITSVLSVALFALFLASFFAREPWLWVLLATAFEWTLLRSATWQYLILKAHPDQLLGLIVAVATWVTIRTWREPDSLNLRRASAWAWGIGLATKASVIFFTPVVGLAFLFTQTRERLTRTIRLVGHVALAYFVIGFPQNFNLPRLFRFLKYQAGYSKPATITSVLEWFSLWSDQAWAPLAACALLLSARRAWRWPGARDATAGLALGLVPFVLLLPQRILPPHDHYPIPIIAAQLVVLLTLFNDQARSWSPKLARALAVAILVFLYAFGITPRGFDPLLARELECREQAREILRLVRELGDSGHQVYLDPYVPSTPKTPGVKVNWRTTKDFVGTGHFDVMVLNRTYYSRYFAADQEDYVDVYNTGASATREFYELFRARPRQINDPRLGAWRRELDRCHWEVWTRDTGGPK